MFNEGQTHRFDTVLNISTISATVPAIGGLDIITSQVCPAPQPALCFPQPSGAQDAATCRCRVMSRQSRNGHRTTYSHSSAREASSLFSHGQQPQCNGLLVCHTSMHEVCCQFCNDSSR